MVLAHSAGPRQGVGNLSNRIEFGTDGWRAIIAEDFTFRNVRAVALSAAQFLKRTGLASRGMVIGYDTRFGSDRFAEAVAEVVTAAGVPVALADRVCPTPAVSYNVLLRKAGGAIVVTSSHNPSSWNGIKYKPEYAGSASPEVVAELEAPLDNILQGEIPTMSLAAATSAGLLQRFDPYTPYLKGLAGLVDLNQLKAAGLRIAVDSMYGAGQGYLASLLEGGETRVTELHAEHNPNFPGNHAPEPISRNLTALVQTMQEHFNPLTPSDVRNPHAFDVGIATDGDADRLGVMDETGVFVTQLQVFALLAYYFLEVRGERGPIVRSITTSRMVDRLGELYNVPVYETAVGFKYLGPKMMAENAMLGGEESGGYGFRGHVPERDGILAGLYFIDLMAKTGKRPSELLADLYAKVGPHFYDRLDVDFDPAQKDAILARMLAATPQEIAGLRVTSTNTIDGFLFNLEGGGWLLIRFSGTEPLMRIYTEVPSEDLVARVLEAGKQLAGVA
jgi:alpha-D-glucose phosphate-specific phosphoglucomutase